MTRKTTQITLGILAAAAAVGVAGCCCVNWLEDREHKGGSGGGHGARTHTSRGWVPIFLGGGRSAPSAPSPGTGTSTSSRGGFGATGSHGGGVGA